MDVSENSGAHKSSILMGFSIINHPFWGTPIFGNTHMDGGFQGVFSPKRSGYRQNGVLIHGVNH